MSPSSFSFQFDCIHTMMVHMIRQQLLIGWLIVLLVASACSNVRDDETASQPDPTAAITPVDEALVARGVEVYRANYCGSCHTLAAAQTRGTFGPAHNNAALAAAEHLALESYSGAATTPAEYIRESIVEPGVFYTPGYETTNHHMPAFTHLSPEDIDAIVYLLMQQVRP